MRLNGQLQRGEQQQAAQHQLRQAHVPLLKKKTKTKTIKQKKKTQNQNQPTTTDNS